METKELPFKCHLFVCVNHRDNGRKSCGDCGGETLKSAIKKATKERGWHGVVRVSGSGCLGLCDSGPNVIIYPQKIWFAHVVENNIPQIIETIERLINA